MLTGLSSPACRRTKHFQVNSSYTKMLPSACCHLRSACEDQEIVAARSQDIMCPMAQQTSGKVAARVATQRHSRPARRLPN